MILVIDPGGSGSIAWNKTNHPYTARAIPMPETRRDTIDAIKYAIGWHLPSDCVCYHEKVASFIPDGGASQMFEFGRNVERCGCIVETLGVRLIEVAPKEWQKVLGLGSSERVKVPSAQRGMSKADSRAWKVDHAEEIKAAKSHNAKAKTDWKNKLKAEAQRRYPSLKVTLKTADALLILDYAIAKERV